MKIKFLITPYLIKNKTYKGIFRIMKICFILLFVFSFQLMALNTEAQEAVIELKTNSMTVGQLIEEIEKQTDYLVVYSNHEVDANRKVDVQRKSDKVSAYLDEAFAGTDIGYDFENNYIVLMKKTNRNASTIAEMIRFAQQQGKTITGKVVDVNGEPIIGTNIIEVGTTNGTVTDVDGNFSLKVADNATIRVSYIGYVEQEINTAGKMNFNIVLQEEAIALQEVVAVGYGVQRKVNLSGSVAAVDVSKMVESRPITNLSIALAGAAPGVRVTSSNNRPGYDDASILVRGKGTLNNASPLIIIDGVEAPISSVNPQDVESISVLKDASSAAIYGSRAANGVILITTKQGQKGTLKLDYNGYMSFESIRKTLDPVSNYADYMEYMNEGYQNSNLPKLFSQEMIDTWRSGKDPILYPNTDWIDATFKTGLSTNHVFSASGGSENVRFYSSFGYLNNPGVMENSGQEKYSGRLNIEGDIRPWLSVGANVNGYFSDLDAGTDNIADVFTYASATTPGMVFRHPDGRYGAMNNPEDDPQSAANNPLRRLNSIWGGYQRQNLRTRFFGTLRPFKGFSVTGSFNYDFTDEEMKKKPVFIDGWNFLANVITSSGKGRSYVTSNDNKWIRHFGDVVARYENSFLNNRFDLSAMAGTSQEQYLSKNFTTTKYDLIDMGLDVINAATGEASAGGSATEWAMRSYFGRINLGWENKYLMEFNLRSDASSRFLKDRRWGYFPSFSAAWRIDQENFMQPFTDRWLSSLKIRASYGSLGNNSVGDYEAQSLFSQSNYCWGDEVAVGMAQTALANALLTWESTYVTNVGIDFGMLKNRLTGSFDVFYKKTKDILIDLPAPLVHGTSSLPKQNAASVTNKGFELALGWRGRSGNLDYGIDGNLTYNKNKVVKFKGVAYSLSGVNYIKEGLPINAQYMLRVDRIIQTDEDLAIVSEMLTKKSNAFAAYGVPQKGDLLYKDINGDGLINSNDRTIVSDGDNPKWLYGFSPYVSYKGIDFSALIQGVAGVKVYWQHAQYNTPTVRYGYQLNREVVDARWYEGRTDASYPRLLESSDSRNTVASDFYLEDKSYLKIRNIQLGYTLPQYIAKKMFLQRFRIYGSLENFFTFTPYRGWDPEVSGMAYPSMKQAVFGINLSF